MTDLVFLALIAGFFVLASLYVSACERIVGPDEQPAVDLLSSDESEAVAA